MNDAATKAALAVGDHVRLIHDPSEEVGVIKEETVNKTQWIVAWSSGKVWIYPSADLVPVAA